MKKWKEYEENFLRETYSISGATLCAKHLNRTKPSIIAQAHKMNLVMGNRWTDENIEFLKSNYETMGAKYCADYLHYSIKKVTGYANRLGLKTNVRPKYMEKENKKRIDMSKFNNISQPETAYILGLLWADGNLFSKGGYKRVSINIAKEDMEEILWVFEFCGEWNINENKKYFKGKEVKPQLTLHNSSRDFYEFLYKCDYQNKSINNANKILDKIPEDLQYMFIRGFLDGDGCLNNRITFAGNYFHDWCWMIDFLNRHGFSHKIYKGVVKMGKYSQLSIGIKQGCRKLIKLIYKDRLDIGFSRKRKKGLEL